MRKLYYLPIAIITILLFTTSCKKTSHCMVKDNSGNIIKDYGVKTGTSTDIRNYENSCKADAVQYGGSFGCNY